MSKTVTYLIGSWRFFNEIEEDGKAVIPIAASHRLDPDEALGTLRGTVLGYDAPTRPVGEEKWESLGQEGAATEENMRNGRA